MDVLLLHNPTAGREDHDRVELIDRFRSRGYEPDYCSTKSDRFPEALKDGYDLIAVAGGDGTVRKVVTRIVDRAVPLVVIPLGTANNIARSLRIPLDGFDLPYPNSLGDCLVKMDLGKGRFGSSEEVLAEGIGMGALAATMDEKVGRGETGLGKVVAARQVVAKVFAKAETFKALISVDGRKIDGNFLSVEALLHAYCGPALRLCPPADSGDGLIDVVIVEEERREEMVAWINSPENSDPPVHIERGKRAVFEWSRKPALRSDDGLLGLKSSVKAIEIRIDGGPLRVVVPDTRLARAERAKDREVV